MNLKCLGSGNMNFNEFEQLINSEVEEIVLTENVLLEDCEEEDYISGIEINADNLIIEGNGHIIDGNKKTPLLKVNAFNVTLKNFRFKNGYSEYSGGAIINNGSLTVVGCIFLDNSSEIYGGAIYTNSKLHIIASRFIENRSDYGGAIYIDSDSILKLEGSEFTSNSSEFDGGAIYNKSKLLIYGSLFDENASFKGGAIYNKRILNVKSCAFINNIASDGNHIESENTENLNIYNCDFDEMNWWIILYILKNLNIRIMKL